MLSYLVGLFHLDCMVSPGSASNSVAILATLYLTSLICLHLRLGDTGICSPTPHWDCARTSGGVLESVAIAVIDIAPTRVCANEEPENTRSMVIRMLQHWLNATTENHHPAQN